MRSRNGPDHQPDNPAERGASRWAIPVSDALARELSDLRVQIELQRDHLGTFSEHIREIEGNDELDDFTVQRLLSDFNSAQTLAEQLRKTADDTIQCVIRKI